MNKSRAVAVVGILLAVVGILLTFWRLELGLVAILLVLMAVVLLSAVTHRYLVRSVGRISRTILEVRNTTRELRDRPSEGTQTQVDGTEFGSRKSVVKDSSRSSDARQGESGRSDQRSNRDILSSDSSAKRPFLSRVHANSVEYAGAVHSNSIGQLEKFALRNRSVLVRDSLAFQASGLSGGINSLMSKLRSCEAGDEGALRDVEAWDWDSVAALARVISNQRFDNGDLLTAEYIYKAFFALGQDSILKARDLILFSEVLELLGKFDEAVALCRSKSKIMQAPLQLDFTIANQLMAEENSCRAWLSHVSAIYKRSGFAGIRLRNPKLELSIDNLASGLVLPRTVEGPKITVIVPTYEGASRIETTLESLVNQTWKNLEIIVVDDGSSRENVVDLRKICGRYEDVILLEQGENLGAYPARNLGLAHSTGHFVTVHDDDDWSHPQKLATQAKYLMNNPKVKACVSRHIRVTEGLKFTRINSNPKYIQANYSSLMLERKLIDTLGAWHEINRGADEEFKKRLERFGHTKVAIVCPLPLSFTRTHEQSLTSGEINRGYQDPSRLFYHASFSRIHKSLDWPETEEIEAMPTPANMRPGMRGKSIGLFDVAIAADFSMDEFQQHKVMRDARIAAERGLRVGLVNLFSPHQAATGIPSEETLELAEHTNVEILALKDVATVANLIVPDPSVLQYCENLTSKLDVKRLLILWQDSVAGDARRLYEESTVVRNSLRLFPNSEVKHFNSGKNRVWRSALGVTEGAQAPSEWHEVPVIGRYSNAPQSMWPSLLKDIQSVYCNDAVAEVSLYGTAPVLSEKATRLLSECRYVSPEKHSFAHFLNSIDFWIPFGEEKGLSLVDGVLEAQAFGKVVILPYRYRAYFGNSAIYASPKGVRGVIERLWEDKFLYDEQAARGLAFVKGMWSPEELVRELGDD